MIVYELLADGGFVAGDTDTGFTAYAYPTSSHATMAKRQASRIAAEMVASANRFGAVAGRGDYDARNWRKLVHAIGRAAMGELANV